MLCLCKFYVIGNEELCVDMEAYVEYTKLQQELQKVEESVKILNTPQVLSEICSTMLNHGYAHNKH